MLTFPKNGFLPIVQTKKHILKKKFYLGQVIKLLIFVNKNIKYDIYW